MPAAGRQTALALTAAALVALLAACAVDDRTGVAHREEAGPVSLGHVHGLGTDPVDDTLYAATHDGVFDLGPEGAGQAERVAGRWQDTMAFTVIGPNHFLASGHPDQRENLPVHLGLIESTDAARTWEPISLLGEADFHALAASGDLVYGYDAVTARLLVTDDRREWHTVAQVTVRDLAVDPTDPTRVLATTADGLIAYRAEGGSDGSLDGAPPLALLDWPTVDHLVGVTSEGVLYRSRDRGETWQPSDGPAGDPQALHVDPRGWYVATSSGLFRSSDEGRTWRPLTAG